MESWTLVLSPIFLGTIVFGFFSVARRFIMKSGVISSLQLLIHLYGAATVVFFLIYLTFWGFTSPKLLPGFWRAVLLGTLVNLFIQFFAVKAASIKEGEISLTAPLSAMTPGLITIMAIALGEYPGKIGIAGITLMALGSYVLLFEKTPRYLWEYVSPVKRLTMLFKIDRLAPEEKGKTIVVALTLGSAILSTFGLLFDGLYTRRGVNLQGLTLAMLTMMGLLALGYSAWYIVNPGSQNRTSGLKIYQTQPKYIITIIFLVIGWVAMIYLFQPTYNHTYVAYVGTLKRLTILITVIFGFVFFREGEIKKRLWAAILIMAGAILISMDDLPVKISAQMEILGF